MFIADIHLYLYACLHSWSRDKCFPSIFIYTYMYYIHLSYSFNPVLFASPSSTPSILNYMMAWWLFTKFCGTGVCSVSHVNLHVVPILDSHRRFVGAFYAKVKKTTVHEHSTKLHSPTNAYIVLLLLLFLLLLLLLLAVVVQFGRPVPKCIVFAALDPSQHQGADDHTADSLFGSSSTYGWPIGHLEPHLQNRILFFEGEKRARF